jgi:hypothetical protein
LNYLDTDGVKVSTEQIDGKGNSSIVSTYAVNVASNVAYVEIWQTDFDGKSKQIAKQYVGISVADHIKLYPNPSNGPTTISGDFSEIEVFDANGAQMSFQLIDNEISGLKTGFYYVVFDNIIVKKLIVF